MPEQQTSGRKAAAGKVKAKLKAFNLLFPPHS